MSSRPFHGNGVYGMRILVDQAEDAVFGGVQVNLDGRGGGVTIVRLQGAEDSVMLDARLLLVHLLEHLVEAAQFNMHVERAVGTEQKLVVGGSQNQLVKVPGRAG